MNKTLIYIALLAFTFCAYTQKGSASERPNFIVIFIDDLGYADISPFGKECPETPNLERMAREGRMFTSFYVASSVCSPSRAAIMTGCYPARVDMLHNDLEMDVPNHAVLWPGDRKGLNPDEVTIAEVMKERGYATACVGKWHLGDQPPFLPTRQGFDEYFGIPFGHDMGMNAKPFHVPPPLVHNDAVIQELESGDMDFLTKRYTEYALDFIRRNAEQPFFIYLAHNMVHGPHGASPAFLGKTGKGIYADAVAEVDWSVGEILDMLVDLNIDGRTLVLFTSDNGGGNFRQNSDKHSSNAPYNGGKNTPAEGGFRVPTIAWWPGTIEAGTSTDLMASTIDLLPTFASLSGESYEPQNPIDGVDISTLFGNQLPQTSPRQTFVYYAFHVEHLTRLYAVREGQWKYYLKPAKFLTEDTKVFLEIPEGALFDLDADPGETENIAEEHPRVVRKLQDLAALYIRELGDEGQPGPGVRQAGYVREAHPLNWE